MTAVAYPSPFARMQHALELRREGLTYQQIADRMGVTPGRAQTIVAKAIKRVLHETAEEVRQLELHRVELLITTLWQRAIDDVKKEPPEFQRLDRLKGLIETKLKFCGAQSVVENNTDNRVQIVIQQFTPPPAAIPPPAVMTEAVQIGEAVAN